jgi:predicted transcriptional regulator YdeE
MKKVELEKIKLIGLSLPEKTTNEMGKSGIVCGNLWQKFEKENYADRISDKLSDEIIAVYHQYEGDYTQPFSYFIGCKVEPGTEAPEGLEILHIPGGFYGQITAAGKMPDCVINTWKEIWNSDIPRAYQTDFEVYDERSKDWNKAEVEVFISIQH